MSHAPEHPQARDLIDIQGNLVGFNKDHQRFLFVTFPTTQSATAFALAIHAEVSNASEVAAFNRDFKARVARGEDEMAVRACWVNVGFTFTGLQLLPAATALDTFPEDFRSGMRARAGLIGDVDTSAPEVWSGPFGPGSPPVHGIVLLAGDTPAGLDERTSTIQALIQSAGAATVDEPQDGIARPDAARGHEHFGFKDGISQPNIPGLTSSVRSTGSVAPGEFLIGWLDETGSISGQALPALPAQPGQPGYPGSTPSPQPVAMPDWTKNASFLVYRRLRQDVMGFHQFTAAQAPAVGLSTAQLEAKLVGRWPSGASLERVPGQPHDFDPTQTDPQSTPQGLPDDQHINKFGYQQHDPDGQAVPLAAHVRKAYPRDQANPGEGEANRHRILRRGIPYGPEAQPDQEGPYGTTPVTSNTDRGLLFLSYQASIVNGFEFIQRSWANNQDFPAPASGADPIISQDSPTPPFPLPANPHFATQRWVTTTGGDYFFAPSLSALRALGQT